MAEIGGSVGDSGKNSASDAAIVQAMLVVAKTAAGKSYLDRYDGVAGPGTRAAILAFQVEQKLVAKLPAPDKNQAAKGPAYKALDPAATPGLVKPNDPTFAKLLALIPPALKDMRTLPGGKTVFLPEDETTMKSVRDAMAKQAGFVPGFAEKVALLVEALWKDTKVVVRLAGGETGARRSFETQYQLTFKKTAAGGAVTNAGPGESNHNFGQAVDLGFEGLRWLRPTGETVGNEDAWLHQLDPKQVGAPEAARFWSALRDTGTSDAVKLNRGPAADHPHLQTWDDANVDMANRLSALLSQVGTAKWKGAHQQYKSDLGYGGKYYAVGKAVGIWAGAALVLPVHLAEAITAKAKAAAVKAGPQSAAWKTFKATDAKQIDAKQIKAVQTALKADFAKADQSWTGWTPY